MRRDLVLEKLSRVYQTHSSAECNPIPYFASATDVFPQRDRVAIWTFLHIAFCKTTSACRIGGAGHVNQHHLSIHLPDSYGTFSSLPTKSAVMAPQKYHLLGGDYEKGDSTYPVLRGHSSSSTTRATTSSQTIFIVLGAIGVFLSGVGFTLAMMVIKSEYYGMGRYETGFREEKLCKSARRSCTSPCNVIKSG